MRPTLQRPVPRTNLEHVMLSEISWCHSVTGMRHSRCARCLEQSHTRGRKAVLGAGDRAGELAFRGDRVSAREDGKGMEAMVTTTVFRATELCTLVDGIVYILCVLPQLEICKGICL